MREICPLGGCNFGTKNRAGLFRKKSANGILARMAKRRIAQIVRQASGCHYRTDVVDIDWQMAVFVVQQTGNVHRYRPPYTRHFEAVGQTIMHKHTARQREYLCLVLQTSKWRRKNQTVVVPLKFGAVVVALVVVLLHTETLSR